MTKPYNGFPGPLRAAACAWHHREVFHCRRQPPRRCMACGQRQGILLPHTEDFRRPFGLHVGRYSLCIACFVVWRCRYRAPAQALAYIRHVRQGYRPDPIRSPGPGFFDDRFLRKTGFRWRFTCTGMARAGEVFEEMSAEAAQFRGHDWLAERLCQS